MTQVYETGDLLKVANEHDLARQANEVKMNRASGVVAPTPGLPVEQLHLIEEDADPFNGNLNNRRVAMRIAGLKRRTFLNDSQPTHIGDPNKAASDVKKSLSVLPEPEGGEAEGSAKPAALPASFLRPPTAGSPAAKAVTGKEPAKAASSTQAPPPAWKPNA